VSTARNIKFLDDVSNAVPAATAPDNSIARADKPLILFSIDVIMHIAMIVAPTDNALCIAGRTSGRICRMIYHTSSPNVLCSIGIYFSAFGGAEGAKNSLADTFNDSKYITDNIISTFLILASVSP
jgi:hypothetical protein